MRTLRLAAGRSLRDVALKMNFSAPYISDLEHGNRSFTEELIERYREALK